MLGGGCSGSKRGVGRTLNESIMYQFGKMKCREYAGTYYALNIGKGILTNELTLRGNSGVSNSIVSY